MAGQTPNSTNINRVASGISDSTDVVAHAEYIYWRSEWRKLRDVLAGQREIKRQGKVYLKGLAGQDNEGYDRYLDGATFYNMTGQTLNGMIGQVFMRDPLIIGLPPKFKNIIRLKFGKDGSGHSAFCKTIVSEQIAMGRYGVLVDAPSTPTTEPISYVVGYATENILDWDVEDVDGTFQLTRVLLREFTRAKHTQTAPIKRNPYLTPPDTSLRTQRIQQKQSIVQPASYINNYTYSTTYRELILEEQEDGTRVYRQRVYVDTLNSVEYETLTPQIRGKTLDFIPFKFFGAAGNQPDVEKPPILDIADLNLSHYRTYALLEWGRAYTALPVYYAQGNDDETAAEYHIGPSMVWEVPVGSEPGIVEYTGQGLKALETALDTKERQISAIGGRMLPGAKFGSESPDQTAARQSSEHALLLNVIQACESGLIDVIRWWLFWRDVPLSVTEGVNYNINRTFANAGLGAREYRAIHMMYKDGVIRIEDFYNYLMKADVLDPETTQEDFVAGLTDPDNFPNNPDMAARTRGYTSRQQELDAADIAREVDLQQQEIDLQEREVVLMEEAPPAPPPAPAGAPRPKAKAPPRPGKIPSKKG